MRRQKSKRNHWVPQAYLRAFAADQAGQKIWTLGKSGGDPQLKPISKVAVRFYLYAPQKDGQRDYSAEHKLSDLEQLFGSSFWKRMSTGFVDLNKEWARKGIALLAAVMFLRNPTMLDRTHAMHNAFRDYFLGNGGPPDAIEIGGKRYETDKDSWAAFRDSDDDNIKRNWLASLTSAAWLAKMLLTMRMGVIASEAPVFITSDNPVTVLHPSLQFRGLKDAETSVLFPLSPTRIAFFDNRMAEPDGQYYQVRARGEEHNMLIWRNAIEHMFSHRHTDEVCAEMLAAAEAA